MVHEDEGVVRSLRAMRARRLAAAREVVATPDYRTSDELIEASDILDRWGDGADRGRAVEARRAALSEPGFERIAALAYLNRRSGRFIVAMSVVLAGGAGALCLVSLYFIILIVRSF